jgi:hypothetical protein
MTMSHNVDMTGGLCQKYETRDDIRSRHVQTEMVLPDDNGTVTFCSFDDYRWPCDAIREADRADALSERLTSADKRADAAEAALAEAQKCAIWMAQEVDRVSAELGTAEAALAECRAALDALLQAPGDIFVRERVAAALAAHKEATK